MDPTAARYPLVSVRVAGPDSIQFLQGYITADLTRLATEKTLPMAIPNLQGRVVANGWAIGTDSQSVGLAVHPSLAGAVQDHLRKFMAFSKSRVEDCRPHAISMSKSATGTVLSPLPCTLEEANEETDPGTKLFRTLCIERSVVLAEAATSARFLPQMMGLLQWDAVSFDKGCYLGQEVIARAQHRGQVKRGLQQYRVVEGLPTPGQIVTTESRRSGTVVATNDLQALVVVSESPLKLVGDGLVLEATAS